MVTEKYNISGMTCAACSSAVERVTRKLEGVSESNVNLTTGILTITYDETKITQNDVVTKVALYICFARIKSPVVSRSKRLIQR